MKIAFRTDASLQIGTGHVTRCLTLAKSLHVRGAQCRFICRKHDGNLIERIRQEGFECLLLAHSSEIPAVDDAEGPVLAHADWLGRSWQSDAKQTIEALGAEIVDWLVVDHYALDKRWEEMLRPHAKKIMAIDDLADRPHDCDVLLDQNFFSSLSIRYDGKVPSECLTLLGPRYALLQSVYAELHSRVALRDGPVRRIFVFFGGVDIGDMTRLSVAAFQQLGRRDIQLDVVMTEKNIRYDGIEKAIEGWCNIRLLGPLQSLGPLMAAADLAVGAGGATMWERFCLGLPSIVISLAENQKPVCEDLARSGLIEYLGHMELVNMEALRNALVRFIDLKSISARSRDLHAICDGEGAGRVAETILAS